MKYPNKLKKASRLEKRTLLARGMKLFEESGECAAEILKLKGLKGSKEKSKEEVLYDLHSEAVDTLIMALDILYYTKASEKRINEILDSQLNKWMKSKRRGRKSAK